MVIKNKIINIFILFFFLSACLQSPTGQGHAATATQGFTATMIPPSTWTPEPTPTPEARYIINPNFPKIALNETNNTDEYSSVLIEDFIKGDILKFELEHLEKNNPFSENVLSMDNLSTKSYKLSSPTFGWSVSVDNINSNPKPEYKNPDTRPIKFLSFYKLLDWDLYQKIGLDKVQPELEELLKKNGMTVKQYQEKQPALWILAWACKNPDKSVTIGHTLLDIDSYANSEKTARRELSADLKFIPGFKISNIVLSDDEYRNTINLWFITDKIYKLYPELDPEPEIQKWLETQNMPANLQEKLFAYQAVIEGW